MWFLMHSNNGPYLLCAWYRPPVQGEVESITSFEEELIRLRRHALGVLVKGDLNLHCQRWLFHSDGNTKEGDLMRDACSRNGLRQIVRKPTRFDNLLDLSITDIEAAHASVSAKIADHAVVTTSLNLALPKTSSHSRKVWSYAKADWIGFKGDVRGVDWTFLRHCDATRSAEMMMELILTAASRHIPQRTACIKKRSHPWLNDNIVELVAAKRAAEGTAEYGDAVRQCSERILEEYHAYAHKARQDLRECRSGSKVWWTLSRELLRQQTKVQSIPALKSNDGSWIHEPQGKAELLAATFTGKNIIPEPCVNDYTDVDRNPRAQKGLRQVTEQVALKTLEMLDENSGTGPDLLPARILKTGAKELAIPIMMLALLILNSGEWPESWREHWLVPIYKRAAVFEPGNYRGVHLTAQLSKIVERIILHLMEPHITLWKLAGVNQFAYTKKRGSRDALALLVLRWIDALDKGRKVLVYCSDVSGAFDKVSKNRLMQKLEAKGIHPKLLKLISSWLEPRSASVVVGGTKSEPFRIQNMVYQGTVLGPQLWNLYFEDAYKAIREFMFDEIVFADDLNAYRIVPASTSIEKGTEVMELVQGELHRWGAANQVSFDPGKESMHILSRTDPYGMDFKLLGIIFDCKLEMENAVRFLTGKVKWKLHMLLRSRKSFRTEDLVIQYKQQVLSYIEYRTPAIYHATKTILSRLDKLQDRFLLELGITKEAALMDFKLAPLSMRRDIAMLGILHRAATGDGPEHFREYFRRRSGSLMLESPTATNTVSLLWKRSIWGLIRVYNTLGGALQCAAVKDLQFMLQERAKRIVVKQLNDNWEELYSPR
jgi:hypothetical protein